MYISKLIIRNFRNFRNVRLTFTEGVNTIIGENGSGKTNLFHAIRILIDDDLPRGIRFFESDFNRSIGEWQGHWIIIQIEFNELDPSEEAQAIAVHKIGNMDEYDTNIGTISVIFRPKVEIRKMLFELSNSKTKTKKKLKEILDNLTINDYETVFTGRGNSDFSLDDNYANYVGDFNNLNFPNPEDELSNIYGVRISGSSIPNEVSCTFAKALRDVEADLRKYKDNPLLNLLRGHEKNIKIEEKEGIETNIEELNKRISELEEVREISKGIADSIKNAVGETYAPNINIKSELPDEMDKLLQSLRLWVGDPDEEGYEGKIWELSLGGANLIYLSMKILEFQKTKMEDKIANFFLIEEPEAHIHTHIQKTLFQKLGQHKTQIIISTHSTHISSVSKISSVNILSRSNQEAKVFLPSFGLTPNQVMRIERYLDAVRTNLLFAKGVILVEGDAEQILIPVLFKKVFGISLDELGISLINIGSTGFKNIAILFHNDRIKKKCAILTDLDSTIIELPQNSSDDTDYQKHCRSSQSVGLQRKKDLDEFCSKSTWVVAFYAQHTFEVDFLLANNRFEICRTVDKAYSGEANRKRIHGKINNEDLSISGKEVLRLAEKFGKGWFSIMLSDNIDHLTSIPEYILKAIVFCCDNITNEVLVTMAKHRLVNLAKATFKNDKKNYKEILKHFESQESIEIAINYYSKTLKNDSLSAFINIIQS